MEIKYLFLIGIVLALTKQAESRNVLLPQCHESENECGSDCCKTDQYCDIDGDPPGCYEFCKDMDLNCPVNYTCCSTLLKQYCCMKNESCGNGQCEPIPVISVDETPDSASTTEINPIFKNIFQKISDPNFHFANSDASAHGFPNGSQISFSMGDFKPNINGDNAKNFQANSKNDDSNGGSEQHSSLSFLRYIFAAGGSAGGGSFAIVCCICVRRRRRANTLKSSNQHALQPSTLGEPGTKNQSAPYPGANQVASNEHPPPYSDTPTTEPPGEPETVPPYSDFKVDSDRKQLC